jgi:biotin carboxyl carrier protein
VTYQEQSIACGDFEWILRGDNVAADSDTCQAIYDEFHEKCCYEPLSTSCNLCQDGINYLDVQPDVVVEYQAESTTCLSVYNSLFVREAADSEQCNAAKGALAGECCFQKCKLCQSGFIDTEASVLVDGSEISCSALDLSFSQSVIAEGSEQCNTMLQSYAEDCCYTMPDTPCRLCSGVYESSSDVMVDFYGEQRTCSQISNKLALSEEAGSETCSSIRNDFLETCCYEKCPVCPTGSNLSWEKSVEYDKSTISCGQFDSIIKNNAIAKGSDECNTILSIYSSPCCYNYATSTGGGSSTQENIPPPPPPDVNFSEIDSTAGGTVTMQKEVGDKVQAGETIATVGAITPPPPPDAGFTEVLAMKEGTVTMQKEVGDKVQAGDTIMSVGSVPPPPPPDASFSQIVSTTEGVVTMQKEVGEKVVAGDTIIAVGSDTGDEVEVKATQDGYVAAVLTEEGGNIQNGNVIAYIATEEADIDTVQAYADDVAKSEVKATEDGYVAAIIPQDGGSVKDGETVALIATNEEDIAAVQEYANDLATADAGVEIKAQEDGFVAALLTPEGARVDDGETLALVVEKEDDIATVQEYANNLVASQASTSGDSASYAAPCSLCSTGDIVVDTNILFNGVQTSCLEVYNFLATQTKAGSETCTSGKEALQSACCLKKCDICSGGGIPDWYANVNINGNSMTCLELDGVIANSQIEQGSPQCKEILDVAAPACCYEPPTEPCNICQTDTDILDVMSEKSIEYGGATATCGQIFNALYTREEKESQTCSMVSADLASECCYNKCSLCGDLQLDASTSVDHSGTKVGCSEFDSFVFASNLITEGTDECSMFQTEYRDTCCYDIPCNLCSKGDKMYTIKEEASVTYGGTPTTCSDVSDFLSQDMSQSNNCLAAQENIFDDCCFQPCEMCSGAGESINWASSTTFNGVTQTCTDVYWMLINDGIETTNPVCNGVSQLSRDCCFRMPAYQCTLCRDDNGVTYNTRWMEEVKVGGVTKTCGDFNTLLSTQEADSLTCTSAREEIFDACCFAGSEKLVAESPSAVVATDEAKEEAFDPNACQLCPVDKVGIYGDVKFNGNPTTCLEVYNFLHKEFNKVSESCTSAQSQLAVLCCVYPSDLPPGENAAFGGMNADGSAPVSTPSGNVITPPTDFDGLNSWTIMNPSSARRYAQVASFGTVAVGTVTLFALLFC